MEKLFYDRYGVRQLERPLDTKMAWPKKGQKLLKQPTSKTPREVTAHLDWLQTFNHDLAMPEAYKESGDFLVEALLQGGDGTHPDRFLFPILYLYRHAVELKLKELIYLGIRLELEDLSTIEETLQAHALYPLWNRVSKVLKQFWPNGDVSELGAVESIICTLHETDKDGQHLRYSKSKDGEKFTHNMPPQIDLLNMRTVIDGLWNLLDGSASGLIDALDNRPSY